MWLWLCWVECGVQHIAARMYGSASDSNRAVAGSFMFVHIYIEYIYIL